MQQQAVLISKKSQILQQEDSLSRERKSMFKIKKASEGMPYQQPQVLQIGTRKPLMIRKNNFFNGSKEPNFASHALLKQESNEKFLNRTSKVPNLQPLKSDRSIQGIANGNVFPLSDMNSLNSTLKSSHTTLQNGIPDVQKLIKMNKTKKRLDSARKSRIQQIKETIIVVSDESLTTKIQNFGTSVPTLTTLKKKSDPII